MVRRSCSSDGQLPQTPVESGDVVDQMVDAAIAALAVLSTETDASSYRAPMPFAWQFARQLILLDEDPSGFWDMAELKYDPTQNTYQELRRASYFWFREALGAAMSRALMSGETAAVDLAANLSAWYETYHAPVLSADSHL